jgi:hypothetical protein
MFAHVFKFNSEHDDRGRFSSKEGQHNSPLHYHRGAFDPTVNSTWEARRHARVTAEYINGKSYAFYRRNLLLDIGATEEEARKLSSQRMPLRESDILPIFLRKVKKLSDEEFSRMSDPVKDRARRAIWARRVERDPMLAMKAPQPLGPTGTLERESEKRIPADTTEPLIQERTLPKNPLKAAVFAQPATAVGPMVPQS